MKGEHDVLSRHAEAEEFGGGAVFGSVFFDPDFILPNPNVDKHISNAFAIMPSGIRNHEYVLPVVDYIFGINAR